MPSEAEAVVDHTFTGRIKIYDVPDVPTVDQHLRDLRRRVKRINESGRFLHKLFDLHADIDDLLDKRNELSKLSHV